MQDEFGINSHMWTVKNGATQECEYFAGCIALPAACVQHTSPATPEHSAAVQCRGCCGRRRGRHWGLWKGQLLNWRMVCKLLENPTSTEAQRKAFTPRHIITHHVTTIHTYTLASSLRSILNRRKAGAQSPVNAALWRVRWYALSCSDLA